MRDGDGAGLAGNGGEVCPKGGASPARWGRTGGSGRWNAET